MNKMPMKDLKSDCACGIEVNMVAKVPLRLDKCPHEAWRQMDK